MSLEIIDGQFLQFNRFLLFCSGFYRFVRFHFFNILPFSPIFQRKMTPDGTVLLTYDSIINFEGHRYFCNHESR
jgi:hypothetical protein